MIKFRKQYKYQLADDLDWQTEIRPKQDAVLPRVRLDKSGLLHISEGFAWDGCSGPVIDRPKNMRAGAVHDGLYLLMRAGQLPARYWQAADHEFERVLLTARNAGWLVRMYLRGLNWAEGKHANPKNRKRVYENSY
jgi:hypothetical protein